MNDEYILRHFGGVHENSLKYLLDDEQNPADPDVLDIIKHSPYTDEEKLMADLTIKQNDFTILSLNCQSLSAKIDGLKILLNNVENNCKIGAICLQESWLSTESDTSLLKIEGYNLISVGKTCSAHGGLAIYLNDEMNYKILNLYEQSNIWEGQFIEIRKIYCLQIKNL